jgi:hypothetical protein
MGRKRQFTEQECLDALHEAATELGHSPTKKEYKSLGISPSVYTIRERFGSWNRAKEVAELEIHSTKTPFPCYTQNNEGYMFWATTVDGTQLNVFEHRLLAAAKYGLEAIKGKHVHHKDGHPFHNTLENIEVLSRTEHKARHKQMRRELANHSLSEYSETKE